MLTRLTPGVLASIVLAAPVLAAPISQRYADLNTAPEPSYQQHVLPLMSKVGCSGRSCHGSFQGAGGFQLSLFGYDFKKDHDAMLKGDEPRVDVKDPEKSLILLKPTMQEKHKGKKIFEKGSWEYNILLKWIQGGAKDDSVGHTAITHIEVLPKELVFAKAGETAQLKVIAHWADGTSEDVTEITRFRTNDEAVAVVDEKTGVVTSVNGGDTHIVAFYDNGVTPVAAMMPVSDKVGDKFPKIAASTKVDELVLQKLAKVGIVPSEICTDEEFLRRLSLDMCGTLPEPEEIRAFAADRSTDKRAKKVEELLKRPSYAMWWTTKLCDITGNNSGQLRQGGNQAFSEQYSRQWYEWIYKRVADNAPYDKIVEGIALGVSRNPGQSYTQYCEEMTSYFRRDNPADFADRASMPYFYMRGNIRKPEEKALAFAYSFLGVRLQCAECHKHPFDQWTQEDFKSFQAFFNGINYQQPTPRDPEVKAMYAKANFDPEDYKGSGNKLYNAVAQQVRSGNVMPFSELRARTDTFKRPAKGSKDAKNVKGSDRVITPKVLGGEEVVMAQFEDPRQPLMDWMRAENNPFFAKSWVNRVWANYFGVGIIEPADDLNLANPPSNAALLDYLAAGFIKSGYDMKWLHREIVNSDTYQRSWKTNETNKLDKRNFSRSLIRRIPAEVAMDSVIMATASDAKRRELAADLADRYIGLEGGQGSGRRGQNNYALSVFGKPDRLSNCDCERSNAPTLLQSIYLANDTELYKAIDDGGWVDEVAGPRNKTTDPKALSKAFGDYLQKNRAKMESLKKKYENLDRAEAKKRIMEDLRRDFDSRQTAATASVTLSKDSTRVVEELFLRTVSRFPTPEELSEAQQHLASAPSPADGLRDLMWTMLNTKEFIVNH